jgi:Flp pilus assembly protein CpaB
MKTFKNISSLEHMVADKNIKKGQKILQSDVLDISKIREMSYRIKPGLRAISLRIADISNAISGLINQGERVDVVAVFDSTRDVDNPYSRIVVQNAKLLAIDKEFYLNGNSANASSKSSKGKKLSKSNKNKIEGKKISVATLAVTPKDAEKLALISERAKFFLVLRSHFDDKMVRDSGVSEREILGFSRRDDLIKDKNAEITIKELNSQKRSVAIYRGVELTNSNTPSAKSANED